MNNQIKGYLYLGVLVGTAVVSFKCVDTCLNDLYEPENRFSSQKAKRIRIIHKVVAGVLALNNTATVGNLMADMKIFNK